eukprot:scaffold3852_cov402-Prasinococcus_capsulatus_cf.AAC.4
MRRSDGGAPEHSALGSSREARTAQPRADHRQEQASKLLLRVLLVVGVAVLRSLRCRQATSSVWPTGETGRGQCRVSVEA